MNNKPRPFDRRFVINLTLKNMRESVELSMKKTALRIPEFEGNPEKSEEIFRTIIALNNMKIEFEQMEKRHAIS